MKGKSEIRFCALGILCLVVIAVAAVALSEAGKGNPHGQREFCRRGFSNGNGNDNL